MIDFWPLWGFALGCGSAPIIVHIAQWALQGGRWQNLWKPSKSLLSPNLLIWAPLSGLLWALMLWRWSGSAALLALSAMTFMELHSITDLRSGFIYDCFVQACCICGLAMRAAGGTGALLEGLLGALAGMAPLAALILLKPRSMGWGDSLLMAGLGTFLGWKMTFLALYLGIIVGGLWALVLLAMKRIGRKDSFPMAPALALGAAAALLWGPQILGHYGLSLPWPWQ